MVAVLCALTLGATLLPASPEGAPGEAPGTVLPPISICPVVEQGDSDTTISVLSSVNGAGRISIFAAEQATGSLDFRTGGSGAFVTQAAEAGAIGLSGGLIEMPTQTTASGVTVTSPTSRAAEGCAATPVPQSFLAGGSTAGASGFEVQLLNPYAGEATVDLTVTTDAGIESDERFDAVIIPPLSTITLDLAAIIPGRDSVSVEVEVTRGSALAVGRQVVEGESAIWNAVAPSLDWWLPVPPGGETKELLVASPTNDEIEFQVDLYGPDGLLESFDTGIIPPRGSARIPLTSVTTDAIAVRVIATGPVVSSLWLRSPTGLAATVASPVDAPTWLLPGAQGPAGGSGNLVVVNTGLDTATVEVRSLQERSLARNFELPAEGVLVVPLVAAGGYRVEATGPVVALWSSQLGAAATAAIGTPIQDG